MGQKVWVALLGFAVFVFAALGLVVVFCWITHRINNSEGWRGMVEHFHRLRFLQGVTAQA